MIVNQPRLSVVLSSVTPTPSPSTAATSGGDVNWTDIVSALSDAVVAIGTLGTLILIVVTVRQQGAALSLQIKQLQDERDDRDAARQQEMEDALRRTAAQARTVQISTDQKEHNPTSDAYAIYVDADPITEILKAERMRETGNRAWHAALLRVSNGSDMVIRNLSCHSGAVQRPQYIWREGATDLSKMYELDQLGPGRKAVFVWMDKRERDLHDGRVESHFSDENGHRWVTNLMGHTSRVDQSE